MLPFSILQSVVQTLLFAFSASGNGIEAGSVLALSAREAWFVASFPNEDCSQRAANAIPEEKPSLRRPFLASFHRLAASKRYVFLSSSSPASFFPSLFHAAVPKNAPYFSDFYVGRDCAKPAFESAQSLIKMRKTFIVCADIPQTSFFFPPRSGALSDCAASPFCDARA
jgi:hypothetical protein